jgi:addiction module HigA family antidote
MTRKRIPLHPGAFVKSVYIEKGGLKADAIADAVGVHKGTMSRLINGHSYMTPAMALKLSAVLGRSPQSWMNMQQAHSLAKAEEAVKFEKWKPTAKLIGGQKKALGNRSGQAA